MAVSRVISKYVQPDVPLGYLTPHRSQEVAAKRIKISRSVAGATDKLALLAGMVHTNIHRLLLGPCCPSTSLVSP